MRSAGHTDAPAALLLCAIRKKKDNLRLCIDHKLAGSTQILLCRADGYHLLKGALVGSRVETGVQKHQGWFLA